MRTVLKTLCLALMMISTPLMALQDAEPVPPNGGAPIPKDLLDLDYQDCMRGCVQQADGKSCEKLCKCSTVESFPKMLDFARYLELRQQLSTSTLTAANQELLARIGQMCFKQLEESGLKIGPPDNPPAPAADSGEGGKG